MFEYWTLHGSSTKSSIISSKDLAIETLKISNSLRPEIQRGPRDTERELRLAELETAIQEAPSDGAYHS